MNKKLSLVDRADERGFKLLRRTFIGKSQDEADEHGYKMSWDSRNTSIGPTTTHVISYSHICVYCGEIALPLQQNRDSFTVTGYTCVCSGSRDEQEYNDKLKLLLEKHEDELHELKKTAPKFDLNACLPYVDHVLNKYRKQIVNNGLTSIDSRDLEKLGIELKLKLGND